MAAYRFLVIIYFGMGYFLGGDGCPYFFCAQPVQHVLMGPVLYLVQLPTDVLGHSAIVAPGKGSAILPSRLRLGSFVALRP